MCIHFPGELGGFGTGDMLQDVQMDDTLYVRNPDSVLPADTSATTDKEQQDKPMDIDFSAAPAAGDLADGLPDYGMYIMNSYSLLSFSFV